MVGCDGGKIDAEPPKIDVERGDFSALLPPESLPSSSAISAKSISPCSNNTPAIVCDEDEDEDEEEDEEDAEEEDEEDADGVVGGLYCSPGQGTVIQPGW